MRLSVNYAISLGRSWGQGSAPLATNRHYSTSPIAKIHTRPTTIYYVNLWGSLRIRTARKLRSEEQPDWQ